MRNKTIKIIFTLAIQAVFFLNTSTVWASPGTDGVDPTNTGTTTTTTSSSTIFNRTSSTGWLGSTGWASGSGSGASGGNSSWNIGRKTYFKICGADGCIGGGPGVAGGSSGSFGGLGNGGYNEQINAAACTLLGIPMGSFGALVMIFAGIIAIVSGAMGAYKMALSTIVVGAGSWILFPIVQMFFPVQCGF